MPTKQVTQKQIAANRANAQESTGPKTPEGKAAIARNGLIHGLCARALILPHDPAETLEAFNQLLADLHQHLAPVGRLEEILIERIAVCHWRLRRAYRFESSAIIDLRADVAENLREKQEEQREVEELEEDHKRSGIRRKASAKTAPVDPNEPNEFQDPWRPSLPDQEDIERLVRYESLIDRELNRVIAQLNRAQALRHQIEIDRARLERRDEDVDDGEGPDLPQFLRQLKAIQSASKTLAGVQARTADRQSASYADRQAATIKGLYGIGPDGFQSPGGETRTNSSGRDEPKTNCSPRTEAKADPLRRIEAKPRASRRSEAKAEARTSSQRSTDFSNLPQAQSEIGNRQSEILPPPADADDTPRPPAPRRHWSPPRDPTTPACFSGKTKSPACLANSQKPAIERVPIRRCMSIIGRPLPGVILQPQAALSARGRRVSGSVCRGLSWYAQENANGVPATSSGLPRRGYPESRRVRWAQP